MVWGQELWDAYDRVAARLTANTTTLTSTYAKMLRDKAEVSTGCFFLLWIQSGGCKSAILRSFKQFLYILHSKLWAHFHFGTFDQ